MGRSVLVCAVLVFALSLISCGGGDEDERAREESRYFGAGIDGYLPGESLQDWVDHAVQVSVVTVISEQQLTTLPTPEGSDQPSSVGRHVTLRIEQTIWQGKADVYPPTEVTIGTWGWTLDDGELRPAGRGRYEVGHTYLVPFVRTQDGWTPLVLSSIPVSGGSVESGFPAAREAYADLDGLAIADVAEQLAALKPDPLLASLVGVPAEERWAAIAQAREQATATAQAGRIPTP